MTIAGGGHRQPENQSAGGRRQEAAQPLPLASPVPTAVPDNTARLAAPGQPPLTQDWWNQWLAHTEWLLDIRLTEPERRECQRLWVQRWQQTDQATKDRFWTSANATLQWSSEVAKRTEAERGDLRAQQQTRLLARLRKSPEPDERMLLAAYDAAHEPGGERNPILVSGTPPLAQEMVDQSRRMIEWVLDIQLTEQQHREYQQRFVSEWKKLDQAARDRSFTTGGTELPAQLPLLSRYQRNLLRAGLQPKFLTRLRQPSGTELSPWLLALYETTHRPGGDRNPILVPGTPALTQRMASQYGDFVEWALDLRHSGGMTVSQRQKLQAMVVSDWNDMEGTEREEFIQFLENWTATAQLPPAERTRRQEQFLPDFLAQLRSASDHEPSQWLLKLYSSEQESVERSRTRPQEVRR
jgi:hypothetical protein